MFQLFQRPTCPLLRDSSEIHRLFEQQSYKQRASWPLFFRIYLLFEYFTHFVLFSFKRLMVQQGTVYRYPALLAVFFILFRNNRYAPDKQTINGILTVHKQSISVPHNKISNMGTRKNDKKLYILLYLIIGK